MINSFLLSDVDIPPELPLPIPIVPICFPAGTQVFTDQGYIPIEKIDPNINTIKNKKIVAITKTITNDNSIVCFEKNSLGYNIPDKTTLISMNHRISYNNKLIPASVFVEMKEGVYFKKYNRDYLYNILMEKHSIILVNGMKVETLDPKNIVAKLYTNIFSPEQKRAIILSINNNSNNRYNNNNKNKNSNLINYKNISNNIYNQNNTDNNNNKDGNLLNYQNVSNTSYNQNNTDKNDNKYNKDSNLLNCQNKSNNRTVRNYHVYRFNPLLRKLHLRTQKNYSFLNNIMNKGYHNDNVNNEYHNNPLRIYRNNPLKIYHNNTIRNSSHLINNTPKFYINSLRRFTRYGNRRR